MQVALINGGDSGLGRATAQRFAADGMSVVVADLDEARARDTAAALPGAGHWGLAMDVADEQSVRSGFDGAESRCGAVAVLACFAGISLNMTVNAIAPDDAAAAASYLASAGAGYVTGATIDINGGIQVR